MAHFLKSNGLYDLLVTRGNWRAVFPLLPQNNSVLHYTVILWNWKYTHYWGSVWPKTNKSGDFIFGTNLWSAFGWETHIISHLKPRNSWWERMCEALDVHHHQLDWPELCTFVGGGGTVTCQDRPNFWKFFSYPSVIWLVGNSPH